MNFKDAFLTMYSASAQMPDHNMHQEQNEYLDRYIGLGDAAFYYSIRLRQPCTQKQFERIVQDEIQLAKKRGRKCFEWKTYAYPPVQFTFDLCRYGFEEPRQLQLMYRDTHFQTIKSPHITNMRVDNLEKFNQMLELLDHVFGKRSTDLDYFLNHGLKQDIFKTPHLVQAFITCIDDQPACVGWVKIYHSIAMLFGGGTLEHMRKKQAYTHHVAARIAFAQTQGCQFVVSESSGDSQKALGKRGFTAAGPVHCWIYRF